MPLDPSIPLQIKPPNNGLAGASPLDLLGSLANIKNAQNQNTQFQANFAAKQKAGAIIAAGDPTNPQATVNAVMGDPSIMANDPDAASNLAALSNTLLAGQATAGSASASALSAAIKGMGSWYNNPSPGVMDQTLASARASLPKASQPLFDKAAGSFKEAVTGGLDLSTPEGVTQAKQRLIGQMYGAGLSSDTINGLTGTPIQRNTGTTLQPGTQAPAFMGGGTTNAPGALAIQPSPTYAGSGLIPYGGSGSDNPLSPTGGGNPPPNRTQANALLGSFFNPDGSTNPGPAGGSSPVPVSQVPFGPTGKPLWQDSDIPKLPPGPGGGGVLIGQPAQIAKNIADIYSTTGLKEVQAAQQNLASYQYMAQDFDQMAKTGGFQNSGSFADFRTDLAKAMNTVSSIVAPNAKPPFDTTTVAATEDLQKEAKRLMFSLSAANGSGATEGVEKILQAGQGIPGINNTPLGARFLLGSLQQASQRIIDMRSFEDAWLAKNPQSNLGEAIDKFNTLNSPTAYADAVLKGMGFTHSTDLFQAVKNKYITPDQASALDRKLGLGTTVPVPVSGGQ